MYAEGTCSQYRTFGYGHSFGVLCHYYGREAGLELREDIDTVLEPGMVVSMEPMIMVPEGTPGAGGYREHDILVVSEDGAENITGFPYGPEHNVIAIQCLQGAGGAPATAPPLSSPPAGPATGQPSQSSLPNFSNMMSVSALSFTSASALLVVATGPCRGPASGIA